MTLRVFKPKDFRPQALKIIQHANAIMAEYQRAGYKMTVRMFYYQFVSRDIFANKQSNYKKLINTLTDGRLAGLVSWDILEDNERERRGWLIEEDTYAIASRLQYHFAVDMWARQDRYVEVWVEKKALETVIKRARNSYHVPFMACKGYLSTSIAYGAGKRLAREYQIHSAPPLIIHLGDHDPSGIDMTRDNLERCNIFAGTPVKVKRIALNRDQIDHYNPPSNPTKMTDTRADDYIRADGDESWELDALDSSVINQLIQKEFDHLIDQDIWDEDQDSENEEKAFLAKVADNWSAVEDHFRSL